MSCFGSSSHISAIFGHTYGLIENLVSNVFEIKCNEQLKFTQLSDNGMHNKMSQFVADWRCECFICFRSFFSKFNCGSNSSIISICEPNYAFIFHQFINDLLDFFFALFSNSISSIVLFCTSSFPINTTLPIVSSLEMDTVNFLQ